MIPNFKIFELNGNFFDKQMIFNKLIKFENIMERIWNLLHFNYVIIIL